MEGESELPTWKYTTAERKRVKLYFSGFLKLIRVSCREWDVIDYVLAVLIPSSHNQGIQYQILYHNLIVVDRPKAQLFQDEFDGLFYIVLKNI